MEKVEFSRIEVDRCTGCKGIWFDAMEEERLAALHGSETIDSGDPATGDAYDRVDRIVCPSCATPLIRMVDAAQPHIRFESCKNCCGIFLDAGEFTELKKPTVLGWLKDLWAGERD